ncbi:hypothetical protein GT204_17290 [Streptomyces sp. SID4919]|uniref:hypothetical protein n=1 Tax=Streptomyces TaxID=1883 RepID=UPI000823C178|nr:MULTISPECIES: hypothetical protein [unclassified Streptomyces]MYY10616.1 hypothetical protein [Streptomyces sp. SID4919]SCK62717.1 hypothetical protein YW7DRAFT_06784 [Streptomyces sp. AmelKG-E11A]
MARHQARPTTTAHRVLLRAGLALTAAGMAFGAAPASAAGVDAPATAGELDAQAAAGSLPGIVGYAIAPVTALQINPLANTGVDPLANGLGTQIADFKPLSTAAATAPLARGDSLAELPLVGPVTQLVTG